MDNTYQSSNEDQDFWEKFEEKPILLSNKLNQNERDVKRQKTKKTKLSLVYPPSDLLHNFQMN